MKLFLTLIVVIAITKDLYADELYIKLSSKNPNDFSNFLMRLLASNRGYIEANTDVDLSNIETKKVTGLCSVCQMVINDVFSHIVHKTKIEVRIALQQSCRRLPYVYRSYCHELVGRYHDLIVDYIVSNIPKDQICGKLRVCQPIEIEEKKVFCEVCTSVINDVFDHIKHRTAVEVNIALQQVCRRLPYVFRSFCHEIVGRYHNLIVNYIVSKIPKDQICGKIGLCAPIEVEEQKELAIYEGTDEQIEKCRKCDRVVSFSDRLLSNLRTKAEMNELSDELCVDTSMGTRLLCVEMVNSIYQGLERSLMTVPRAQFCQRAYNCITKSTISENKVDNIIECWLCKEIMKALSGLINKKSTARDIANALAHVCDILPGPMRGNCVAFIRRYAKMILDFLVDGVATGQICRMLTLCHVPDRFPLVVPLEQISPCRLCKQVVFVVDRLTIDGKTKINSDKLSEELCSGVGPDSKIECGNIVKGVVSEIDLYVSNGVSKDLLCQKSSHCDTGSSLVNMKSTDVNCLICKEIMKLLAPYIKKQSTRNQIRKALLHICDICPKLWRKKCKKFVNKYSDKIVDYIVAGIKTGKICRRLGVCSTPAFSSKDTPIYDPTTNII